MAARRPAAGRRRRAAARRPPHERWGPYLAIAACGAAFLLAVTSFLALLDLDERTAQLQLFSWVPVGGLQVDFGLLLDPLSATFTLLITGVGFLIHVYSLGYMAHDPRRRLFFAYLNLFVAAMLVLVLGDSYLALFLGWEGVGLASYLLISFWFYVPAYATAAKKAFIMNRVGDVGLLIAMFLMFATLGTTQFSGVFAQAELLTAGTATAIGLLLLLGACGKSGQFPLHTWLPDAMAGPTPVSALIHAATMVTAGVYLIARSLPLYEVSETARLVVGIVGVITLVIGAVIGCAYDDIKKVLAYSTVSQIGYMFLAVAIPGAGAVAILHLLTHGFFKACMFLSAGSVMHGMDDQVDMRRFGGLRKEMPVTFACMTRRLPGDHRLPAVRRLLLQGPHHRGGARPGRRARLGVRPHRDRHRRRHRVLHDPHDDHDVLRRAPLDRGPAPARVAGRHDRARWSARGRLGRLRLRARPRHPADRVPRAGARQRGGRPRARADRRHARSSPRSARSACSWPTCSTPASPSRRPRRSP